MAESTSKPSEVLVLPTEAGRVILFSPVLLFLTLIERVKVQPATMCSDQFMFV